MDWIHTNELKYKTKKMELDRPHIAREAMGQNPQGMRKRVQPKIIWKWTVIREAAVYGKEWGSLQFWRKTELQMAMD